MRRSQRAAEGDEVVILEWCLHKVVCADIQRRDGRSDDRQLIDTGKADDVWSSMGREVGGRLTL